MELVLLADDPSAIEKVAGWYFEEWASDVEGVTLEQVVTKVSTFTGRDTAPMSVLAKEGDEIVGAAEFKIREMDIYPDYEFWMGGVFVDKEHRGKGVAAALVSEVLCRAKGAGVERLYLQTEDLSGGLYRQHGFEPLEEVVYKGIRVLVMEAILEP